MKNELYCYKLSDKIKIIKHSIKIYINSSEMKKQTKVTQNEILYDWLVFF